MVGFSNEHWRRYWSYLGVESIGSAHYTALWTLKRSRVDRFGILVFNFNPFSQMGTHGKLIMWENQSYIYSKHAITERERGWVAWEISRVVNGSDLRAWGPEFESGSTFLGGFGLISWDDVWRLANCVADQRIVGGTRGMFFSVLGSLVNIAMSGFIVSMYDLEIFTLVRRRTRGVKKS